MNDAIYMVVNQNHLQGIDSVQRHMMLGVQKAAELYLQRQLAIDPENIIHSYYEWLNFAVGHMDDVEQGHAQQLIIDTMQVHVLQGQQLSQIFTMDDEQSYAEIRQLVSVHGPIIVPILRLIRYISDTTNQMLEANFYNPLFKEKKTTVNLTEFLHAKLLTNFQIMLQELILLEIAAPELFFLQQTATILGWVSGFFSKALQQSGAAFFNVPIYWQYNHSLQIVNQ
jgi:hypothetical protein